MEHNGLASQILVIVFGEGDVDVLLLAGRHAHQLLLKAGDEGTAAQLQVVVLALAALKGNAVIEALEVDIHGVAHLSGTVRGLGGGYILRHSVQLRLHLCIRHDRLSLFHFQALVLAQRDLGVHVGHQCQGNHVLVINVHVLQRGTADRLEVLTGNGKIINLGEDLFQTVFIENMSAVHALDHLPGSLALPETGDHDALASLHVCGINTGLHQLLVDLHHDGSLVAILFGTLDNHYVILLKLVPLDRTILFLFY